jgi:hypothetical protein
VSEWEPERDDGGRLDQTAVLAQVEGRQAALGVDFKEREVKRIVGPEYPRPADALRLLADVERESDLALAIGCPVDHVGVGDEEAGPVDAECRTGRLALGGDDLDQCRGFLAPFDDLGLVLGPARRRSDQHERDGEYEG